LLYVEADAEQRQRVGTYVGNYEFQVTAVAAAADAHGLLDRHRFDLVLLDLPVPSGENWTFLHHLVRKRQPPVLVTSTDADETNRILVLEAGADDYLTKPFNPRELVARLHSVARRRTVETSWRQCVARFDGWTLDVDAHAAQSESRTVTFTAGEMALLNTLMEHPGRVFARHDLLAATRHDTTEVFDRTVDVLISRLRRKLERDPLHPEIIQTVRGGGYLFSRPVTWSSSTDTPTINGS
jgi:two-component system OmpR family response regulator